MDEAAESYRHWWSEQFGRSIDRSGLRAESNVLRYRPVSKVLVRVDRSTAVFDVTSIRTAAEVAGVPVEVSGPPETATLVDVVEDDASLAARLVSGGFERLRLLGACDDVVRKAAHEQNIAVDDRAVTHDGRVELPCWVREQAISRTVHRHGRVPS